ncbi:MAG: TAXI family TRAP transporter solute-binding subunit [Streptosporangiales bacterium]|nr:TAXI family TRAP transporter solute-binding subunit [Streptosporangiales bacterium]
MPRAPSSGRFRSGSVFPTRRWTVSDWRIVSRTTPRVMPEVLARDLEYLLGSVSGLRRKVLLPRRRPSAHGLATTLPLLPEQIPSRGEPLPLGVRDLRKGWAHMSFDRKRLGATFAFAAFTLAQVALAGCGSSGGGEAGGEVDNVTWGTSSQGSEFHALSVAMGDVISQETDMAASVQSVGGSDATIRAIGDGKTDVGMANSFAATNAFNGTGAFDEAVDFRLVTQGHNTLRQLIVRADSGIETPADLEGKRIVGERPALAEIRLVTDAILQAYGVNPDSVEIVSTAETNEALRALQQGTVDAVVAPGSAPSGFFIELAQNRDVEWIDLSDRMDELLQILGPGFVEGTIPAGTYNGQDEEVHTPAIPSVVAARTDMPEDAVYEIEKALAEHNDQIAAAQPQGKNWTAEAAMEETPTVPFHPGAVRYYKEAGVWTDEMQQAQDELLQG